MQQAGMTLLIAGSTGAVGQQVLALALENPAVLQVIAPTRRPLCIHPKLINPVLDASQLHHMQWQVDAVICALGSTIKQAGSQAAFAAVDRDLVINLARHCQRQGAKCFVLNSSLGAKAGRNFYLTTKAQAEQGVRELDYPSYYIVRPSLIDAQRENVRQAERIGLWLAALLKPLIPKKYRPVKAQAIAACMLNAALEHKTGEHVIESDMIC